ncbi:DUF4239 domain-containing protein [Janibacter cremeus]|uniref:DUF4239 domain-containing protein n=1 Tax=Janibacter cremeus TaxID=1285192 RepID=A0A852VZX3_9MICO|nr:DUF4239 domain-containing protein [Janibacter cremeus]NYF99275.1 hypothetical protein [Janibacter cremeus]
MSSPEGNAVLLVVAFLVAFALCVGARKLVGDREVHVNSWASTLSYIATAYGVVVGFSILFLFGQFADARQAVGAEATSIGTAYNQAELFPGSRPAVQRALICYARSVPTHDWPALAEHTGGSPEVDATYLDLVLSLGERDEPATGALHAASATNLASQIGSISTAREIRIVAAETRMPPMLWALLVGGGVFVVMLIFAVTLPARRNTQALLVSMSSVFTVVLLLIVVSLANPFGTGGGRVTPRLIEETATAMTGSASPAVGAVCASDQ